MKISRHYGSTRVVLCWGRWAFKFPRFMNWRLFLCGLLGNMQEARANGYGHPVEFDLTHVARVVLYVRGGFLVVAERTRDVTEAEWKAFNFEAFANAAPALSVENKRDSFGVCPCGRIVAIDYGNGTGYGCGYVYPQ